MIKAVVFLPLIGALITGLGVRFIGDRAAQLLTTGLLLAAAVCAGFVFNDVVLHGRATTIHLLDWFSSGDLQISWALKVDSLTAVMLIVVTWVSSAVHMYSIGYMSHDPHKPRFMAYLSLFTFFMLMLVTADNFLQLFFGWEGVGLASYLLIGFWFKKESANAAAIKAFVVNRVGDFGLALGVIAIFWLFGTLQFDAVFAAAPKFAETTMTVFGTDWHALTLICVLLFIGCMGKSAQLGLHTWLPDAMEGPTPVSALIHAATMVTAGVFLVARCSPLFELSETALTLVTVVGAVTALFAASVALVQNDIKKVIAYSTCSQLGYMFFACGVSAYSAGVFHLMTHAFFKALLFLGAGSVIHAMSDEQDLRKMGGIWKKIPATYALVWIGSLALAGIPPFAGFYSKDLILESAWASHTEVGQFAFWMGILVAFMTAFYSWRLLIMAFHGKPRCSEEVLSHVHESPKVMMVPLLFLGVGAIAAGWIGHHTLQIGEAEGHFWGKALFMAEGHTALANAHHVDEWVKQMPLAAGVSGIVLAYLLYMLMPRLPGMISRISGPIYHFLRHKWYFDILYYGLFVHGAHLLGKLFWKAGDVRIIDGCGPNGAAWVAAGLSRLSSRLQSGYVYHYAFAIMLGLVALVSWYAVRMTMTIGG